MYGELIIPPFCLYEKMIGSVMHVLLHLLISIDQDIKH